MIGLFKKNKKRNRSFLRKRGVEFTTPLSIRIFVLACATSIAAILVQAVTTQLSYTQDQSFLGLVLDGLGFFCLPILIALTISSESVHSRKLIACFNLFLSYKLFHWLSATGNPYTAALPAIIISVGSLWWLFLSKKIRIYYAVLSNKPLPNHLESNIETIMSPSTLEKKAIKRKTGTSPHLDSLVMLIIFILFFIAVFINKSPTMLFIQILP